ncbi:MAG: hypothetical protein LBG80_12395, partial [Bacteroidales bacterium]|nr:hypothetical protein [Bacteroidales bacterium]
SLCLANHVNATDSDNFSLTVGKGKPDATPNPAAVNETVTFRFTVSLFDSQGKRLEEVPAEVKQITYSVNCTVGTITNVNPNMVISTDKHSASKTIKHLYSGVSATAQFPQTGNLSLGLTVTITFNDDSYLQMSHSIFVNVVDATLTVYADPPQNPSKVLFFPNAVGYTGFDIGHSFWKVEIDSGLAVGTNPQVSVIDSASNAVVNTNVRGKKFGFYPDGGIKALLALQVYDGEIRGDESHPYQVSKSYSININKAIEVVNKIVSLVSQPGQYHVLNIGGHNCTGQCVNISNNTAGCNAPNGIGMAAWRPNANIILGIIDFKSFPNPYHHAEQLLSAP